MGFIVRSLLALWCAFALFAARPVYALDTGDIVVASLKGEVHIVVRGTEAKLLAGSVLQLPATVRTGRDGAIELRQGATSISVGPETLLEFPALVTPGGSIDRIVQPKGTSFYNVGKRGGRKLRIETPFLVGVVKGTQFSVVAQDGATTISLFEGLLEVRSADDSDVIDLHAGEIASRDRAANDITVTKMESDVTPAPKAPATRPPAGTGENNPTQPVTPAAAGEVVGEPVFAGRGTTALPVSPVVDVATNVEVPAGNGATPVDVGVETPIEGVDTRVDVGVDSKAVALETAVEGVIETPITATDVSVDLGASTVLESTDTGVAVDVAAGVGTTTDAAVTVDLSTPIVETQVTLDTDLGLTTELDLGLDASQSDDISNSGSGSDNSGPGSDNSGPGNVIDDLLGTLTRSGKT